MIIIGNIRYRCISSWTQPRKRAKPNLNELFQIESEYVETSEINREMRSNDIHSVCMK